MQYINIYSPEFEFRIRSEIKDVKKEGLNVVLIKKDNRPYTVKTDKESACNALYDKVTEILETYASR